MPYPPEEFLAFYVPAEDDGLAAEHATISALVREVWAASSPKSEHGVDITETFDAGVESLRAHKAYIDGLGWEHFDPAEFLEGISRATGQRLGVAHAVGFEVFPMGWGE